MYSILNTAFLVTLALIAWLVLCYLKKIDTSRPDDFDIDVELKSSLQDESDLRACPGEYDAYIKFGCICTCVFALAKIFSITEVYVMEKVPFGKLSIDLLRHVFNSKNSLDMNELIHERERLLIDLEELRKYNSELVERLRALELNRALLQRHDPANLENFELKAPQQNIFIANQHLYVTAEDYANESFAYIWSKYLQKENVYAPIGKDTFKQRAVEIDTVSLNQQFGNNCEFSPVIVSTEDLQKMRGIF